jgi:hypothetical protein
LLRSVIGHNTNIWAAKGESGLLKLKGVVGMMDPNDPVEKYTGEGLTLKH